MSDQTITGPAVSLAGLVPNQRYALPDNTVGLRHFKLVRKRSGAVAFTTWLLFVGDSVPAIYPPDQAGDIGWWLSDEEARDDLAQVLTSLGFQITL
jgi:hypothetical protein